MEKHVTEEEMKRCDGQDGRPAYVAFRGRVYDVSQSQLWSGGMHRLRHQAGRDLTTEFGAAPHDETVFQRRLHADGAADDPGLLPAEQLGDELIHR